VSQKINQSPKLSGRVDISNRTNEIHGTILCCIDKLDTQGKKKHALISCYSPHNWPAFALVWKVRLRAKPPAAFWLQTKQNCPWQQLRLFQKQPSKVALSFAEKQSFF